LISAADRIDFFELPFCTYFNTMDSNTTDASITPATRRRGETDIANIVKLQTGSLKQPDCYQDSLARRRWPVRYDALVNRRKQGKAVRNTSNNLARASWTGSEE
jgi:hypothetical protein